MVCTRCGSEAPADARFCRSCGAPMEAAPVQEERKLVSVLFVDVVGSATRADGADPEDVRAQNQLYYGETRARIERFGGVVEKYVGDAVMAVFGALADGLRGSPRRSASSRRSRRVSTTSGPPDIGQPRRSCR